MKKIKISLLLTLSSFINISCAQEKATYLDIEKLSASSITYKTPVDSIEFIIKGLKKEIIDDSEAMGSDDATIYHFFKNDDISMTYVKRIDYMNFFNLSSIAIKNNKHSLKINDFSINVGDNYKRIKEILPYEYNKFIEEFYEMKLNKNYRIIGGNLTYDGLEPTNIVFRIANSIITSISIGFPDY